MVTKKKKKKEKHIEKIKHFLTQGKSNSDLYASVQLQFMKRSKIPFATSVESFCL